VEQITLGIIPAPGLPAEISNKIQKVLSEKLQQEFPEKVDWKVEYQTDRITGSADRIKKIMDQAKHFQQIYDWDYVISLTDLPVFHEKSIVLSDIDTEEKLGLISLPAFGIMPTAKRIKSAMVHIVQELYYQNHGDFNKIQFASKGIGVEEVTSKDNFSKKIPKTFRMSKIKRISFDEKYEGVDIRFVIQPKFNGKFKIVSGLTFANQPWTIMPSFRKVIGLAFATGSYMLIFNTLWQLSGVYEFSRFLSIMFLALLSMVAWLIFAHSLWEKKETNKSAERLRLVYNTTTITTLAVAVVTFYLFIFILFLFAVVVFVPSDTFGKELGHSAGVVDYLKLAWLVSSAATLAGSVGAGLENEDAVKKSAYGYRQYTRSKELEEEEKRNKEKRSKEDAANSKENDEKDKEEAMKEQESEEKEEPNSNK